MSEMIERVAHTMRGYDMSHGHAAPDCDMASYLECARFVIEAMREPTEAMVVKGDDATWEPSSDRPYIGEFRVKDVWSTMINEALK